uniref:Uncharacterized protein n=1 Tax=Lepeophtheirus salmonis TaxID=72036 RepID=A0A0K2SYI1_LEPSM
MTETTSMDVKINNWKYWDCFSGKEKIKSKFVCWKKLEEEAITPKTRVPLISGHRNGFCTNWRYPRYIPAS